MTEFREAQWIWSSDPGVDQNQWRWFRAEFRTHGSSPAMELSITADTRYRVWLNGVRLGDGPHLGVPWRQLVDSYDLGSLIRPEGPQCLAVLVNATGRYPDATRGGLIAEVHDGDQTPLATDETWRVRAASSLQTSTPAALNNRVRPYAVVEDRRLVPEGWQRLGFDASSWANAETVPRSSPESPRHYPWTHLVHEPLPVSEHVFRPLGTASVEECLDLSGRNNLDHLIPGLSQVGQPVAHAVVEVALAPDAADSGDVMMRCSPPTMDGVFDPCLTLDFGTVRCARLSLDVSAAAGTVVDIGFAERLVDGHFSNAIEGPFAERITLEGGRQTLESWHWQAFQFIRIRVRNGAEGLRLHGVLAHNAGIGHRDRGSFAGESGLETIEGICRSTLRLCSVDGIVDTPWREAGQWLGDGAAVITGGLRACFGDSQLSSAFFRRAAACQLPSGLLAGVSNSPEMNPAQGFADFSMWWVIGLWRHYRWSGDDSLVHDHYGHLTRLMKAFSVTEVGALMPETFPVFVDWSPVQRSGQLSYLTALFIEALRIWTEMATLIGDSRSAAEATMDRQRLLASFEDRFVDPKTGAVRDSAADGTPAGSVSEVANAAAVAFSVLTADAERRAVRAVWFDDDLSVIEAQPFGTALVLEALAAQGEIEQALRIVRDRWGKRMVDRGATTTYEEWSRNGSWRDGDHRGFMRSSSHAWSAFPTEFLIRLLPGIDVVEAGCRTIRVAAREHTEDFESVWPTPLGSVTVRHRQGRTTVEVPGGVAVETQDPAVIIHQTNGDL